MPKALSILAMAVSVLLLLVFGLDLAVGFPFQRENVLMSGGFVAFAVVLGYLSWSALREFA